MPTRSILGALSLATIAFLWLTMRTSVDQIDGPVLQLYGFPLPYRRWSQFSSLHYDLDVVAMAVDYLVYAGVFMLSIGVRRVRSTIQRAPRWAVGILVCGAAVSSVEVAAAAMGGALHPARFSSDTKAIDRGLHVGPHYPY